MPVNNLNSEYSPVISPTALVLLVIFIIAALFIWYWHGHRFIAVIGRELAQISTSIQTANQPQLEGQHFIVKYQPGDQEQAQLVLDAAENFIKPVADKLAYKPKDKTLIVVYPNREQLNDYFGWPANESAMGVYWAGTIRVLAPREWIDANDQQELRKTFFESGPMAHEIAHLVVDYQTKGNYSRWFTEGVAQYVEMELTGFRFKDPAGNLNKERYSIEELTKKFDYLPNQSLAYKQSLAAVYYLADQYGEQSIIDIMTFLSYGLSFDQALQKACGLDLRKFENQLNNWLNDNWEILA